jgi:hypothetical protein
MNWEQMQQVGNYRVDYNKTEAPKDRRKIKGYSKFRKRVKDACGNKCAYCGVKKEKGIKFHVHHLDRWADNPKLRFNPNNGVILCTFCHDRIHGFGMKKPDPEMTEIILEYMKGKGIRPAVKVVEKGIKIILRKNTNGRSG